MGTWALRFSSFVVLVIVLQLSFHCLFAFAFTIVTFVSCQKEGWPRWATTSHLAFTTTQRPEISKKRKKWSLACGDLNETLADYPVGDHHHAFTKSPIFMKVDTPSDVCNPNIPHHRYMFASTPLFNRLLWLHWLPSAFFCRLLRAVTGLWVVVTRGPFIHLLDVFLPIANAF